MKEKNSMASRIAQELPKCFLILCGHILLKIRTFRLVFRNGATTSQVCRTAIIRPALESSDPRASNGGPNVGV